MEAAEMVERVLPPMHPNVGITKAGVARIYREQGRDIEAIELYKEIFEIYQESFNENSSRMADIYQSLSWVSNREGDIEKSEDYLKKAI